MPRNDALLNQKIPYVEKFINNPYEGNLPKRDSQ